MKALIVYRGTYRARLDLLSVSLINEDTDIRKVEILAQKADYKLLVVCFDRLDAVIEALENEISEQGHPDDSESEPLEEDQ